MCGTLPRKDGLLRKLFTCGKNVKDSGIKEGSRKKGGGIYTVGVAEYFANLTLKLKELGCCFGFFFLKVRRSTVYVAEIAVNKWLCQNIITPE